MKNLVNVDALIDVIRNGFDDIALYHLHAKEWNSMSDHEKTWYERNAQHGCYKINDFCDVLRVDCRKLQTIARLARKWEEKHNWQLCFPTEDHAEKILAYIRK